MQFNQNQQIQAHKFNITTTEIREIVNWLNKPPFEENYTLVNFDELKPQQLRNLLQQVFKKINDKNEIDLNNNKEEEHAKLIDFMNMLGYVSSNNEESINGVFNGKKDYIYPILYFILQNFDELKNRAYLGYYLVPLNIPDEYLMDKEMKEYFQQYEELKETFKNEHTELEELKKNFPDYDQMEKDNLQLEKERDQLKIKLKTFQHEKTEKKEFQELLKSTSMIRKEQEEETRLVITLENQKEHLDNCEELLITWQQRLLDVQNAYGQQTSASEMLNQLRNEIKYQRKQTGELNFEILEKNKKFNQNERKLNEPIPPQDVIDKMELQLMQVNNNIRNLQNKIEETKQTEKEDKLQIFRRQVQMVVQKRDDLKEELKLMQEEQINLEIEIEQKKQELEKQRGPNIMEKQDVEQFQDNLKVKIQQEKQLKSELQILEQEIGILKRTEQLLKKNLKKTIQDIKEYEAQHGVTGMIDIENEIENLAQKKGALDQMKGKTLEELSQIVEQLQLKIEDKRDSLKPMIEKHKILKKEISELKQVHQNSKQEFDLEIGNVKTQYEQLNSQSREKREQYFECEISIDLYKEKGDVLDLVYDLLEEEKNNIQGKSQYNKKFKSYQDFIQDEIESCENEIQNLKIKRDQAKENSNNSGSHVQQLNQLIFLLEEKAKSQKRIPQHTTTSFKTTGNTFMVHQQLILLQKFLYQISIELNYLLHQFFNKNFIHQQIQKNICIEYNT